MTEADGRRQRFIIGIVGAAVLAAMCLSNLAGQGAQYDELHQAANAFAYCGRPTGLFSPVTAYGLPVMNMTYSAAIKTAIFGLWLRATDCQFSIEAWRTTGVLFVAAAIVLFAILSRARSGALAVVVALVVTDASIIVGARHDYGPIALALALRLLLLGVWLAASHAEAPPARWSFALGALTGLACFEKLSSIVLLPVLVLFVSQNPRLCRRRNLGATLAGVGAGLLPLIWVNAYEWNTTGRWLSTAQADFATRDWSHLVQYVSSYLSIGVGAELQSWILGVRVAPWRQSVEAALVVAMIFMSGAAGAHRDGRRREFLKRPAAVVGVAYLLCLMGTWLLPAETEVHHWIVGTPFHYVAFGLAAMETGWASRFVQGGIVLLLLCRVPGLVALETALAAGSFGPEWHPDLTRMGQWASKAQGDVAFVAGDWGIGTSIACFSNGLHKPLELFWNYERRDQLSAAVSSSKTAFYLITLADPSPVNPSGTKRLVADAASLDGWHEEPIDSDAAALAVFHIRRFVRNARTESPQ